MVLDPTLLLNGEDWSKLANPDPAEGPLYPVLFCLRPREAAPYALALSQKTGWPIVQLGGARQKIDGASELS